MSAPLTGGFQVGAQRFAVDGDFSSCDPCGLPVFSYPMPGDSIFSNRSIIYYDPDLPGYAPVPLGTFPNIQPWSPNQVVVLLEQEFMVGQEFYTPMRLNTPYNSDWATGWMGQFPPIPGGQATVTLEQFYLVKEGALEDMGGGISKLKRTWATIPPTRNEVEQFSYNFIGYGEGESGRKRTLINVLSRLQYDYYIFDDRGVIPGGIGVFPDGPILNASTGLYPDGLILPPQYYYQDPAGVAVNQFTDSVTDGDGDDSPTATVPTYTTLLDTGIEGYTDWVRNGYEIIAEGSTMNRWMGNIFERRTRFVLAQ